MIPRPRLQEELAYHPPVLKKVVSPAEKLLQAVLVAVVGTGLGVGVGVFLAGRTLPSEPSEAVVQTPAVGIATTAAVVKTPLPAQAVPVVQTATNGSGEKQTPVAKAAPVAEPPAASHVHQPRLLRASVTAVRGRLHHRHGLRHRAALLSISFLEHKPQPLVEEARLEIPDGRFRFTIEGDQTAVAYDAQSGVVSTDGSGLFVVDKAPGEVSPVVHPQEAPSNVHYKCDQDANCSLIMASIVVPHARMRTVTHATDWAYIPVSTESQAHDGPQAPVYYGHVSR